MNPFVNTFPKDEVLLLLPLLRGQVPADKALTLHAALMVCDYGVYMLSAQGGTVVTTQATLTAADVANMLETLERQHDGVVAAKAIALPWQTILPILWPMIQRWLEGRLEEWLSQQRALAESLPVEAACKKRDAEPVKAECHKKDAEPVPSEK